MIPIKEEPEEYFENTKVYERCHFCKQQTRYWHENTNNPVCKPCSKKHKVSELPDFGQNLRRKKEKARAKHRTTQQWQNGQSATSPIA